jgi:hypothetical protein
MSDSDIENALAQARGAQSVLLGLLIALQGSGQSVIVKKAFDIAGDTFTAASMSADKAMSRQASAALQVIDHMRQTVIRNETPRKDV